MKQAKPIVSIMAILASGAWITYVLRSGPKPGETISHRQAVACAECGKAYDGMLGDPPGTCHYCNQKTLWPALKCGACSAIFPMITEKGKEFGAKIVCTKCGKSDFGDVSPSEVQQP